MRDQFVASYPMPKKDRETYLQPNREGKKSIILHLEPDMHKRLKIAAAQDETTLQALGIEAIQKFLDQRERRK